MIWAVLILLVFNLIITGSIADNLRRMNNGNKGVELPILWLDEHSAQLEELGVNLSKTDFDNIKMITFYKIDTLTSVNIEGRDCTIIMCSGEDYTTTLLIEEVKQLIEND